MAWAGKSGKNAKIPKTKINILFIELNLYVKQLPTMFNGRDMANDYCPKRGVPLVSSQSGGSRVFTVLIGLNAFLLLILKNFI